MCFQRSPTDQLFANGGQTPRLSRYSKYLSKSSRVTAKRACSRFAIRSTWSGCIAAEHEWNCKDQLGMIALKIVWARVCCAADTTIDSLSNPYMPQSKDNRPHKDQTSFTYPFCKQLFRWNSDLNCVDSALFQKLNAAARHACPQCKRKHNLCLGRQRFCWSFRVTWNVKTRHILVLR